MVEYGRVGGERSIGLRLGVRVVRGGGWSGGVGVGSKVVRAAALVGSSGGDWGGVGTGVVVAWGGMGLGQRW